MRAATRACAWWAARRYSVCWCARCVARGWRTPWCSWRSGFWRSAARWWRAVDGAAPSSGCRGGGGSGCRGMGGAVGAGSGWGRTKQRVQGDPRGPGGPPHCTATSIVFGIAFGMFVVLYLANAMAPEISPDGATYHLGLVSRYLREHGFVRITDNLYAAMPEGVEMLFLFAFAFGKHSAAALVHFVFFVALGWQVFSYARRRGFPVAGASAALVVFASPVAGIDGTSAYNDVAVAAIAFTLFHLLQIWDEERQAGYPL